MKTLRRLALIALFAAGTAAAQNLPPSPAPAVPGGTPTLPADQLRSDIPKWFKGTTVGGKGDAATFFLPKMPHTLDDGKETMQWSVYVRLQERAEHPTAVRIFFPTQAVPANAHPDRLADLMNMSGGIQDSPAYFIVSGGKERVLALVTEMPADELTQEKLETEIKGLFRAAERTLPLWGGDLTKPLAKKADGVTGTWEMKGLPADNVGAVGLTLNDDGTGKVTEYFATNAPPINRAGKYTRKGDEITFTSEKGTTYTFTVSKSGDELTVTCDVGGKPDFRTLTRKK